MNTVLSIKKAVFICTAILLCFTFTSWKGSETHGYKTTRDTVPPTREKKIRDLDDVLEELNGAQEDLDKSISDINWNKIDADLKNAMKDLDVNLKGLNADLKKSLSEIDVAEIQADVETSVKKIDWDEIKKSIDNAKEIDLDKMKAEMEKAKGDLEKQKPLLEKSLRDAHEGIEKAKGEFQQYKGFVDGLERDGLIHKDSYTIEHRNGKLIINNKQQPAEVYNKYRSFLETNKTFMLKKNHDGFDMNKD